MLLLDEPFGALDAKVRAELREWLRRLHEEVHVTTLLVTHDQEEALSIADNIAVMDNAHIEQVGGPRELYDRPANPFVMGFLGPVAKVDGRSCARTTSRSARSPTTGAREAQVTRVSHLGFEVRVELQLSDGEPVFAQLTRTEAAQLELSDGRHRVASPYRGPRCPTRRRGRPPGRGRVGRASSAAGRRGS